MSLRGFEPRLQPDCKIYMVCGLERKARNPPLLYQIFVKICRKAAYYLPYQPEIGRYPGYTIGAFTTNLSPYLINITLKELKE